MFTNGLVLMSMQKDLTMIADHEDKPSKKYQDNELKKDIDPQPETVSHFKLECKDYELENLTQQKFATDTEKKVKWVLKIYCRWCEHKWVNPQMQRTDIYSGWI